MNWFTSDTHFAHSNICRGTSKWESGFRDFDNLSDMNKTIVDNINKVVQANDVLWHLGDWSFGGFDNIKHFRDMINCKTINHIFGNHDSAIIQNKNGVRNIFNFSVPIWHGKIEGQYFFLNHFAQRVWEHSHHGSFHLYGHSHSSLPDDVNSLSMDIGVDGEWLEITDKLDWLNFSRKAYMTTNFNKCYLEKEVITLHPDDDIKVIHPRFTPYSVEDIKKIMSFKTFKPVDHHNEKVD